MFSTDNRPLALALQRIEVRAFSCLLEELLACCQSLAGSSPVRDKLTDLQAGCASQETAGRPLFAEIEAQLALCRQAC